MYEFASSSATLLTVYTAVMHTRRMNVIPEVELWNYDTYARKWSMGYLLHAHGQQTDKQTYQ